MPNSPNVGRNGAYWIQKFDWDTKPDGVIVNISGALLASEDGQSQGQTNLIIFIQKPSKSDIHPAFTNGMLAEGLIRINGKTTIAGNASR
ncbi:MAG: hypothetical protein U5L11_12085 [Arhodomonas sp.]|nr:hypothetical protein [Arhodomonas sp.]